MRFSFSFSLLGALLWMLTGCQDVIELDLNSTEPMTVIEAALYGDTSAQTIRVSQSTYFYDTALPPAITNAVVSVSDDAGNTYAFAHTTGGVYACPNFLPLTGRTYTLSVQAAGNTYSATATLPQTVAIDSISVREAPQTGGPVGLPGTPGGDGTAFDIQTHFADPVVTGNNYRLRYWTGEATATEVLFNDSRFGNGTALAISPAPFGVSASAGDTVLIALEAIEIPVYAYFSQLVSLTGAAPGGATAAPANPTSNLSGGALGYFGIFGRATRVVVVP